ncbi:hypothetical protein Goarm_004782 [Gossypium armourianum]|uniref:Uncharacterized protein n=1 Tax=Gossypium armourianum TaxID=34283 RepID=A0A7J9JXV1_9ROSI|nr:hypothetical protein [Gossypium armourianum]
MWENAGEREWTKFCLPAEEPIVIPLVQEFYLALKQKEVTRPFYEMRAVVKVGGVNILVTKRSICQFYDAPYYYRDYLYRTDLKEFRNIDMEEILRFLMDGKEMWTYKIEMSKVGPTHAIKTYGINHSMVKCARNLRRGMFFPHLIIGLCRKAGVPIERMDKIMNPS